jgi:para-nitrobenzyl esterase
VTRDIDRELKQMNTIEVRPAEGPVRGTVENGVAVFRGVPFAEAPVGRLRFLAPAPARRREHVLDTTSAAAVCPQIPARLGVVMGECPAVQDENCLTVSVWAPLAVDRLRPVLVWFHGGGYLSGGGSLAWYDGGILARENDIVVIGVNSRLGALGYLFKPGLNDGNMGLWDQIQALEWIVNNAASFGGDSKHVTLMGQSGGGHSITCMLSMPKTRGLIQRVISLSTPFALQPFSPEEAATTAARFCDKLQVDLSKPDALSRLQATPIGQILDATISTLRGSLRAPGDPTPPFGPVATDGLPGGAAFQRAVEDAAARIDALIGTTADETLVFCKSDPRLAGLTFDSLPRTAEALFGSSWSERIERAHKTRPGATALEVLSEAQTAHYFGDGAWKLASAVAAGKGNAWMYRFDWSAAGCAFGACHCVELPFAFGTLDAFERAPMLGAIDDQKKALSAVFRGAIGSFVKHGTPNADALPPWPKFLGNAPVLMQFNSALRCGLAQPSA